MSNLTNEEEVKAIAVKAVNGWVKDKGVPEEKAIDILAETIDALIPLDTFFKGPLGRRLERGDRRAIKLFLRAVLPLLRLSPDKIRARANRAEKRGKLKAAERKRAKADRVEARQEEITEEKPKSKPKIKRKQK